MGEARAERLTLETHSTDAGDGAAAGAETPFGG